MSGSGGWVIGLVLMREASVPTSPPRDALTKREYNIRGGNLSPAADSRKCFRTDNLPGVRMSTAAIDVPGQRTTRQPTSRASLRSGTGPRRYHEAPCDR